MSMRTQTTDSEVLIAVLASEAKATAGEHLDLELLLDYHSTTLPPAAERRVRNHLVGCRRCTRLLLDLVSSRELSSEPQSPTADPAVIASWRELAARIGDMDRASGRNRPIAWWRELGARIADRVRRVDRRWHLPLVLDPITALLILGIVGLSFWNLGLRQELAQVSTFQLNPPVSDLIEDNTRGEESQTLEVPTDEPFVYLILYPDTTDEIATFKVEILDGEGETIWNGEGKLTESETLEVRCPTRQLPPGDYRVRVYGLGEGRPEVVLDRSLTIRYVEPASEDSTDDEI